VAQATEVLELVSLVGLGGEELLEDGGELGSLGRPEWLEGPVQGLVSRCKQPRDDAATGGREPYGDSPAVARFSAGPSLALQPVYEANRAWLRDPERGPQMLDAAVGVRVDRDERGGDGTARANGRLSRLRHGFGDRSRRGSEQVCTARIRDMH
jgi:hypothetical protein